MRRICTTLMLLVGMVLLPTVVFAQTGKIVGTVTDAATGDPLPGVNVYLDGTTQGTSTDFDGRYVIIGVRPGSYTLVASYISFATQRVEGVQVSLDLTTTINFELSEEILVGEEVVVVAEAVAVKKDLTSSESRITSETIDKLPVTELGQVLEVQAGITNRGGLHVRGGRSSEVIYMVDGVPVSDSYDGSSTVQLENDGIEELQVVSGTFNAEYGNAMSGVINIVTKEGRSDRFGGSVSMHTVPTPLPVRAERTTSAACARTTTPARASSTGMSTRTPTCLSIPGITQMHQSRLKAHSGKIVPRFSCLAAISRTTAGFTVPTYSTLMVRPATVRWSRWTIMKSSAGKRT